MPVISGYITMLYLPLEPKSTYYLEPWILTFIQILRSLSELQYT
jgi:hypothetical protein